MKAFEQCYRAEQGLFLSLLMKPWCVTIQMKATEHYLHVVLLIMPCIMVLTFKCVDETLVCDHSNESY